MSLGLTKFVREVVGSPHYRVNPAATIRYAYAKWTFRKFRRTEPAAFLADFGIDPGAAFDGFERWRRVLETAVAQIANAGDGQGGISFQDGMVLYGLARALRPDYVIETGVAAGASTSFFGAALIENGRGKLFSIELPTAEVSGAVCEDGSRYGWQHKGVGWAVPAEVRRGLGNRCELILRDVRVGLPTLLERLPYVDIFFHDDLHTPDHMRWEYELVWPKLRDGGVLASDDVNHGWIEFCDGAGLGDEALRNIDRFCMVRKAGYADAERERARAAGAA
jgi:hypothetical protein